MYGLDLVNKVFGKLTVLEKTLERDKSGCVMWKCKCDCGNITFAPTNSLTTGHKRSCGCLQKDTAKEVMSRTMKKRNKFDLSNEYGVGYTVNNEMFYFDKDDYKNINEYYWYINKGYVMTYLKGKIVQMHRFVMGLSNYNGKKVIDHINHITYDNRKENLRICTQKQNSYNNSKAIGICFDKSRNKWVAVIRVNGKNKNLGRFCTKEEALNAREKAVNEYFGEFSYHESMKKSNIIKK